MKMIKDETSAVTVKETRMDFYQATPPEKCKLHKFGVTYSKQNQYEFKIEVSRQRSNDKERKINGKLVRI